MSRSKSKGRKTPTTPRKEVTQVRQGDVLIFKAPALPEKDKLEAVARENGRIVLAHGEATGHAHAIPEVNASFFQMRDMPAVRFVHVPLKAYVEHEEHEQIDLPGGTWQIRRQREHVPGEFPRTVED